MDTIKWAMTTGWRRGCFADVATVVESKAAGSLPQWTKSGSIIHNF